MDAVEVALFVFLVVLGVAGGVHHLPQRMARRPHLEIVEAAFKRGSAVVAVIWRLSFILTGRKYLRDVSFEIVALIFMAQRSNFLSGDIRLKVRIRG